MLQLTPFIDTLRVIFEPRERGRQHVYGTWVASSYTIPFTGGFDLDKDEVRKLAIVGANSSTSFGGNLVCGLAGKPGLAWKLQCAGAASPFATSGSALTQIPCNQAAPSVAAAAQGKAAGE